MLLFSIIILHIYLKEVKCYATNVIIMNVQLNNKKNNNRLLITSKLNSSIEVTCSIVKNISLKEEETTTHDTFKANNHKAAISCRRVCAFSYIDS